MGALLAMVEQPTEEYKGEHAQKYIQDVAYNKAGPDHELTSRFVEQVKANIDHSTLLEIGCGSGELIQSLLKDKSINPHQVLGIDLSYDLITKAKSRLAKHQEVMDLENLNMEKVLEVHPEWRGKFDLIVGNFVFHYTRDVAQFTKTLSQLLKPNGKVILTFNTFFKRFDGLQVDDLKASIAVNLNGCVVRNPARSIDFYKTHFENAGFSLSSLQHRDSTRKIYGWDVKKNGFSKRAQRENPGIFDENGNLLVSFRAVLVEFTNNAVKAI